MPDEKFDLLMALASLTPPENPTEMTTQDVARHKEINALRHLVAKGTVARMDGRALADEDPVSALAPLMALASTVEALRDAVTKYEDVYGCLTEQTKLQANDARDYIQTVYLSELAKAIAETFDLAADMVHKKLPSGWAQAFRDKDEAKIKADIFTTKHAKSIATLTDTIWDRYRPFFLEKMCERQPWAILVRKGMEIAIHGADDSTGSIEGKAEADSSPKEKLDDSKESEGEGGGSGETAADLAESAGESGGAPRGKVERPQSPKDKVEDLGRYEALREIG